MIDPLRETAPPEARATRLKRLRIRCWRRGMKEMDLILGPFADALLKGEAEADLDALESLMSENDQDLYLWITGAAPHPPAHRDIIETLRAHQRIRPRRDG